MPSEMIYKQSFQSSNNGIIITDKKGLILDINTQAVKLHKVDRAKVCGVLISDVLPISGKAVLECLKRKEPQFGLQIHGNIAQHVLDISLIQNGNRICGAVCTFQEMGQFEISARKLKSYQNLSYELEAIFNASSDGLWVCDCDGNVISINKASEQLNGITAEETIGHNIADVLAKGYFDKSVSLEVLQSSRQVSIMQFVKRTNRYLLSTGTPVFDPQGKLHLVVVTERDMTQLNATQEELEQTQMVTKKIRDELAELQMLEVKDQTIIAESKEMRQVLSIAMKLARSDATNILILGESGTGKGLIAKFIHNNSNHSKKPFIAINCAALPESLLEAELFGYEHGAFTGAREQGKAGLFELAHEGTLFLDEIGDLPLTMQAKLLKYFDDHEIMRLGGLKPRSIDCTVIAATNRKIKSHAQHRKFRKDLFYRLNAFSINIPPLRERPEDIFELIRYFMVQYSQAYRTQNKLMPETLERLQNYSFPGNVRELKNLVKRAVVMGERDMIDAFLERNLCRPSSSIKSGRGSSLYKTNLADDLKAFEKEILRSAIRHCHNTQGLADAIGISQPTASRKMKKHSLHFKKYNVE